jgi:hypothetical protein
MPSGRALSSYGRSASATGRLLSPVPVFTTVNASGCCLQISTSGVRRAMLFPKLILQAEFAANATVRQRMAIKRKQLRAKRPAKQTSPS